MPPQLKLELSAADQPVRPARAVSGRGGGELLLRRAGGRARGRGPGDDRARTSSPSRTSPAFISASSTRNSTSKTTGSRRAGDRRCRQIERDARPRRSARPDQAAGRDDPGQRLRAERAGGQREPDPADPHPAAGDRLALAGRRRRDRRGAAGEPRNHRPRRRRQARRRQGLALGIAARELGIFLVLGQRFVAAPGAGARSAARNRRARYRRRWPGDAVADAAGRALSLGGHGRRERRPIEPALSCRLVGRGGLAGCPRQADRDARQGDLPAGRDRKAV